VLDDKVEQKSSRRDQNEGVKHKHMNR